MGRHEQKSGAGGTETKLRAYPQAKRVYVEPEGDESRTRRRERDYESVREERSSKRWLAWAIPLVIVLAAAAIWLGSAAATANQVAQLETIFPNVYINGVNVGGLTPQQALEALQNSGADPYKDAAVTVRFPGDKSLTVTAEELGLSADPVPAIQEAYAYGRTGKLLQDMRAYRAARRSPVNIAWTQEVRLEDADLRTKLTALAGEVEQEAANLPAEIGEEGVTLVKQASAGTVNVDDVVARVRQAFVNQTYDDIQVELTAAEDAAEPDGRAILQALYDKIFVEAKAAVVDGATGAVTEESVRGVSFDMDEALRLWNEAKVGDEIFIPFQFTEPEESGTPEEFPDCLAEKTTSLAGSSSARISNVNLTAQAMDGTVVRPGETFDYNTCLGQRTEARGYQAAGAYSGGKHVTEVGGGICQGSSTLYWCALHANLNITARENHYFTVSYLPRGFDATVSWGGPEFRFVNTRSTPIKIRAWVYDGNLTVQIWGTSDGTRVEMTSETWEDAECYYAQTYRTVYAADGSVIRSGPEAYSRYHKYESGTNTPPPEDTPEPATPTPEPTAEPTPEPVTPEPVTPEPITPEPLTPEPITPEPLTPEPVTPEPATPEPVTPEPATPEPVIPDPVTPEPVAPDPEPVVPDPEPVVPEPLPDEGA